MNRILTLWFAVLVGAVCCPADGKGAVREVPPSSVSTFLDAFPQTLRLNTALTVGSPPWSPTWDYAAWTAAPAAMFELLTNGPSLAYPLRERSDGGLYRALAVDGFSIDQALVQLSVSGPAADVDALHLESRLQNPIHALFPLPDGSLIRAGAAAGTDPSVGLGLGRHRPDGTVDPAWSALGNTQPINLLTEATFLVIVTQRTGGVVLGTEDGRVLRVAPSGQWDVDFSNRNHLGSRVRGIAEDSAGRLVVGTSAGLLRLLADGAVDPGFQLAEDLVGRAVHGLHVFPDDSMVVAHQTSAVTDLSPIALTWLRPDGTTDPTRPRMEFQGGYQMVKTLVAMPDQTILVGGWFEGLGGFVSPNLVRVVPSGAVDPSPGLQLPRNDYRNRNVGIDLVVPLRRGGFAALGRNYFAGSGATLQSLVRSDASGKLTSFSLPELRYGSAMALVEDRDGRLLIGGTFFQGSSGPQLNWSTRFVALRLPEFAEEDIRPPLATGQGQWLRDVVFRNAQVGFAVGDGGRVFRTDDGGRNWSRVTTGFSNDLFAVAVDGPVVDVAGSGGLVARMIEGDPTWHPLPTGVTATLRSMAGRAAGAGLVVGDGGTILLKTNDQFVALDSGTTNDLVKVAGPMDQAYISGRAGTILRLTTNGLAAVLSGTTQDLAGIAEDGTAVTVDGRVSRGGRVWETIGSRSAYTALRRIGASVWAGGTNGTVEKDFVVERSLPTTSPIMALVPLGQHIHAFAADGSSFVMRQAQSSGLTTVPFTLVSPTNGQRVVKSGGTFSLQATGAPITAVCLVQARPGSAPLVQSNSFGRGVFGPATLFVQTTDQLVGPVAINLDGPPELAGLGTPTQPLRRLAAENGTAGFDASFRASGPLVFEWFRNGRRIVGATNPSLSVTGLSAAQAGTYQLVARSGDFSSTGAVALIVTNQAGATLLPKLADQVLYAGERIQFQIPEVAEPYSSASLVRQADGKVISSIPSGAADSGVFGLILSNASGRIVAVGEPGTIMVRDVTNRTIILSERGSFGNTTLFNLGSYLVGGEDTIFLSLQTRDPLLPSGVRRGHFFNGPITSAGSNSIGMEVRFRSFFPPTRPGASMGFIDHGFSAEAFRLSFMPDLQNPSPPSFTDAPLAPGVLGTNGALLPARFFFAPTVLIDQAPARRSTLSPLSNDVQMVSVTNNSFGRAERIRLRFSGLGRDSNGAPITVANATGEDQFGPYLDIGPVEPGVATNVAVRYVVPDGTTLPDPVLRIDWPESLLAGLPSSTFVSIAPDGSQTVPRTLRFNTVRGWNYRVQGAATVSGPWANVSEWFPGNDSNIDWPIPPNPEPGDHFWRIEVTPHGD